MAESGRERDHENDEGVNDQHDDWKDPYIVGMSYNSARDELYLADDSNKVVGAIRVRDNTPATTPARQRLRDVYRGPHDTSLSLCGVCHMRGSDMLLVSSIERRARWLVVLRRNDSEWREAQRVQTDVSEHISGPLSGSRVLIGEWSSKRMELFRVESGPRIARVHLSRCARRVRILLSDVRQRHARGDDIPQSKQLSARASTSRRPAGGNRSHWVEGALESPVAR